MVLDPFEILMEVSGRLGAMPFIVTEYGRKMGHMGHMGEWKTKLHLPSSAQCHAVSRIWRLGAARQLLRKRCNSRCDSKAKYKDYSYQSRQVILTAFPQVANEASRTALNRLAARLGLDTQ